MKLTTDDIKVEARYLVCRRYINEAPDYISKMSLDQQIKLGATTFNLLSAICKAADLDLEYFVEMQLEIDKEMDE